MTSATEIDPRAPENIKNPYPFFETLRREAPVYYHPKLGYVVTRYDDILAVTKNTAVFSSDRESSPLVQIAKPHPEVQAILDEGWPDVKSILVMDEPEHHRYRGIVSKAFTPRRVANLEPQIRAIAEKLVDGFIAEGSCDFMAGFAIPLPIYVIGNVLGVPEADYLEFQRRTQGAIFQNYGSGDWTLEKSKTAARDKVGLQRSLSRLIEDRRAHPRDDILSILANTPLEGKDGRPLDMANMLGILTILIAGGNDTTTSLLGSTMQLLIQHPGVLAAVEADRSRIPTMVEEVLRLQSPVRVQFRTALEDTEVAGVPIPQGASLYLAYGSANYDETAFPHPTEMDIDRPNAIEHFSFGKHIHYCIGAPLARLEARVAFETVFSRMTNFRFEPGHEDDFDDVGATAVIYSLRRLHIAFDRR